MEQNLAAKHQLLVVDLQEREEELVVANNKAKKLEFWKKNYSKTLDATEAAVLERDTKLTVLAAELKALKKSTKNSTGKIQELESALAKEKKARATCVLTLCFAHAIL